MLLATRRASTAHKHRLASGRLNGSTQKNPKTSVTNPGAWLLKHEGRRAWRALNDAIQTGRMPGRELADAGLVLVGGTLLLTPGFVTDVFGFFCVLPFSRPLARRILLAVLARRVARSTVRVVTPRVSGPRGAAWWGGTGHQRNGPVVDGEVVEDDHPER